MSVSTNHNDLSYAFYNQFQLNGGGTSENPDFGMGTNVMVPNWAYVTQSGTDYAFIWGPTRALYFDSGLAPKYGARATLTQSGGNFRLCDTETGVVYVFDDGTASHGLLKETVFPGGTKITNTITDVAGKKRITQSKWSYSYTICNSACPLARRHDHAHRV